MNVGDRSVLTIGCLSLVDVDGVDNLAEPRFDEENREKLEKSSDSWGKCSFGSCCFLFVAITNER